MKQGSNRVRDLDEFYRFLQKRDSGGSDKIGGEADPGGPEQAGSAAGLPRYTVHNGVTVPVPPPPVVEVEAEVEAEPEPPAPEPQPTPPLILLAALAADLGGDAERQQLVARLLDPLLTLEDTARLLGVAPATVRRWANAGTLAHTRTIGQQRRFRLGEVLRVLARARSERAEKAGGVKP